MFKKLATCYLLIFFVALPFLVWAESSGFSPDFGCTLRNNLIAAYKLGEVSGTRLDETTNCGGGGCDLTDNNTVTQAVGIQGNAAQFTSANSESLSRADEADLSTGDIDFAVAAWVYLDTLPSGTDPTLASKRDNTTTLYEWALYAEDEGIGVGQDSVTFQISNTAGSQNTRRGTDILATATWYLAIAEHDAEGNLINLRVNNGSTVNTSTTVTISDTAAGFYLGARDSPAGNFMNGRVDEVGFWKRELTAQEESDLWVGGIGNTYNSANVCLSSFVRHYYEEYDSPSPFIALVDMKALTQWTFVQVIDSLFPWNKFPRGWKR